MHAPTDPKRLAVRLYGQPRLRPAVPVAFIHRGIFMSMHPPLRFAHDIRDPVARNANGDPRRRMRLRQRHQQQVAPRMQADLAYRLPEEFSCVNSSGMNIQAIKKCLPIVITESS